MSTTNDTDRELTANDGTAPHTAARPMKVIIDEDGCNWLCDAKVNDSRDLAEQGCWRCSEMAFTRNG